jgi:hypothetical protein
MIGRPKSRGGAVARLVADEMDIEDLDCPAEQDQVEAMGQQGCWIAKIGGLTKVNPGRLRGQASTNLAFLNF